MVNPECYNAVHSCKIHNNINTPNLERLLYDSFENYANKLRLSDFQSQVFCSFLS